MALHRFDLNDIAPTPWKNGGGTTREIACWPPGAGMGDFGWRVSVATVAQAGPFSAFPGVDRQIMWLSGGGLQLRSADGAIDQLLQAPWRPFAFAGETALDCTLAGGVSQDFNLMLRRGAWRGDLEVVHQRVQPGSSPAGLCMVLAGTWRQGGAALRPGQGVWWSKATAAQPLAPEPAAQGAGAPPALAWIALHPEN
ncbi:HutD family protein [Acidovorax sp. FG27]